MKLIKGISLLSIGVISAETPPSKGGFDKAEEALVKAEIQLDRVSKQDLFFPTVAPHFYKMITIFSKIKAGHHFNQTCENAFDELIKPHTKALFTLGKSNLATTIIQNTLKNTDTSCHGAQYAKKEDLQKCLEGELHKASQGVDLKKTKRYEFCQQIGALKANLVNVLEKGEFGEKCSIDANQKATIKEHLDQIEGSCKSMELKFSGGQAETSNVPQEKTVHKKDQGSDAHPQHDAKQDQTKETAPLHDSKQDQRKGTTSSPDTKQDQTKGTATQHDTKQDQAKGAAPQHDTKQDQAKGATPQHDTKQDKTKEATTSQQASNADQKEAPKQSQADILKEVVKAATKEANSQSIDKKIEEAEKKEADIMKKENEILAMNGVDPKMEKYKKVNDELHKAKDSVQGPNESGEKQVIQAIIDILEKELKSLEKGSSKTKESLPETAQKELKQLDSQKEALEKQIDELKKEKEKGEGEGSIDHPNELKDIGQALCKVHDKLDAKSKESNVTNKADLEKACSHVKNAQNEWKEIHGEDKSQDSSKLQETVTDILGKLANVEGSWVNKYKAVPESLKNLETETKAISKDQNKELQTNSQQLSEKLAQLEAVTNQLIPVPKSTVPATKLTSEQIKSLENEAIDGINKLHKQKNEDPKNLLQVARQLSGEMRKLAAMLKPHGQQTDQVDKMTTDINNLSDGLKQIPVGIIAPIQDTTTTTATTTSDQFPHPVAEDSRVKELEMLQKELETLKATKKALRQKICDEEKKFEGRGSASLQKAIQKAEELLKSLQDDINSASDANKKEKFEKLKASLEGALTTLRKAHGNIPDADLKTLNSLKETLKETKEKVREIQQKVETLSGQIHQGNHNTIKRLSHLMVKIRMNLPSDNKESNDHIESVQKAIRELQIYTGTH